MVYKVRHDLVWGENGLVEPEETEADTGDKDAQIQRLLALVDSWKERHDKVLVAFRALETEQSEREASLRELAVYFKERARSNAWVANATGMYGAQGAAAAYAHAEQRVLRLLKESVYRGTQPSGENK